MDELESPTSYESPHIRCCEQYCRGCVEGDVTLIKRRLVDKYYFPDNAVYWADAGPIPADTVSIGPVSAKLRPTLNAECLFPDFLQSPHDPNSDQLDIKPWSTRAWWLNIRSSPKWVEKQEVFVRGASMWRYRENTRISCDGFDFFSIELTGGCSEVQMLYNRTCLLQETETKFRVLRDSPNRSPSFMCMEFIKRGENVIQVREGPERKSNDQDLCDEEGMVDDDWPWIAPWENTHYRCPVIGGYTFRTISRLTNDDICHKEWRRPRMDAECIMGDGLEFFAPKASHCNPFSKLSAWTRLGCWAHWEQNGFIYLISGPMRDQPKFCLRFPKNMDTDFSALVYFSVICPTDTTGTPPHGIEYYELRMSKRDDSKCEDEGKRCRDIARRGGCKKKDPTKYAPHCRKSCGLCPRHSFQKQICVFPAVFYGTWTLYNGDRTENVTINGTHVSFSELGDFACAEPHPTEDKYKLKSAFQNGCSSRFTCIEMKRYNQNLLQYRLGRSERRDKGLNHLCVFSDDPAPYYDSIRSFAMKNLVARERLMPSSCGISGTVPFNGTIEGRHCTGYISDWDGNRCGTSTTLRLWADDCPALPQMIEFDCLAFIQDDEGIFDNLLITRTKDKRSDFNCWVLSTYKGIESSWPYRVLYRLNSTQCDWLTDVHVLITRQPKATLYLQDDAMSKDCQSDNTAGGFVTDPSYWPVLANGSHDGGYTRVQPGDKRIRTKNTKAPRAGRSDSSKSSSSTFTSMTSTLRIYIFLATICYINMDILGFMS